MDINPIIHTLVEIFSPNNVHRYRSYMGDPIDSNLVLRANPVLEYYASVLVDNNCNIPQQVESPLKSYNIFASIEYRGGKYWLCLNTPVGLYRHPQPFKKRVSKRKSHSLDSANKKMLDKLLWTLEEVVSDSRITTCDTDYVKEGIDGLHPRLEEFSKVLVENKKLRKLSCDALKKQGFLVRVADKQEDGTIAAVIIETMVGRYIASML
ncbi:hypothetical protein [Endozoicomonas sp. ONNA1]|uniref:hypothetical protein n=1 Tax=Endozoicomonas sp. ONNA1 TaxID=2828740 RepID=UPI002148807E|nr:hypothetical protein [Endozoicomonas sp. ONNA1]